MGLGGWGEGQPKREYTTQVYITQFTQRFTKMNSTHALRSHILKREPDIRLRATRNSTQNKLQNSTHSQNGLPRRYYRRQLGVHQQPIWHFMQYREAKRSHNNHLQRVVADPKRQAQDSFCWMEIGRPPTTGCSIGVGHFPLNLYNVTNCARHSRPLSEFVPINVVDKSL